MTSIQTRLLFSLIILSILLSAPARAEQVRIAVASNFKSTMLSLIEAYQKLSADKIVVSYGSTGKHYAQIINGAPFDLFYAADEARPELLVRHKKSVVNSQFIYAIGKLVLWNSTDNKVDSQKLILMSGRFRYLALANPKLSPYGLAAQQVISKLELTKDLNGRIIQGENIAQTFQFVDSHNADLGFVAYSQILARSNNSQESYWLVPQDLYQPIKQRAVVLNETKSSLAFFQFTKSPAAHEIIRQAGYDVP